MNKYNVRICSCGRIHFLEENMLEKAFENNSSILYICANCNSTHLMWVDISEDGAAMTCRCIENEVLNAKKYNIEKIISSEGEKVLMATGEYANFYGNGRFLDLSRDISEGPSDDMKIVETNFLIQSIKDEDKLKALNTKITNIDWSGTKYER